MRRVVLSMMLLKKTDFEIEAIYISSRNRMLWVLIGTHLDTSNE